MTPVICRTPGCGKKSAPGRQLCHCCRGKERRKNNPLLYIYQTWKYNAKRRGKYFDVTFSEFKEFCRKTGYDQSKGVRPEDLSIDRIDPCLGYTKSNIRAISLRNNVMRERGSMPDFLIPDTQECPF